MSLEGRTERMSIWDDYGMVISSGWFAYDMTRGPKTRAILPTSWFTPCIVPWKCEIVWSTSLNSKCSANSMCLRAIECLKKNRWFSSYDPYLCHYLIVIPPKKLTCGPWPVNCWASEDRYHILSLIRSSRAIDLVEVAVLTISSFGYLQGAAWIFMVSNLIYSSRFSDWSLMYVPFPMNRVQSISPGINGQGMIRQ